MHRLIPEMHNPHEFIRTNHNYCSSKEIFYRIHSLYKHCLLSAQDAPEELTIPIFKQIHRYLNFYHRPHKLKHSIKAGQKPIHFVLNKLSEHSHYLLSLRDHLISKYNSGSYSSLKEFSVGVQQKHYPSISPFLNEEINKLLYDHEWLPRNSAIIRSAAFKMQTKDLHHSGAEKYHLDNDPECIKVIIFPFHRDEDDGCFTYRSMNQSNNKFSV